MKKMIVVMIALVVSLSGCLPTVFQPKTPVPTPISEADLQATAAILSQQTLQSLLPTPTILPSVTPVVLPATQTPTLAVPTETQNPVLLTLTATLGTGTVTGINTTLVSGTLPFTGTPSATAKPAINTTPTETAHPLSYGTLPPNLPSGRIVLVNKAKVDVYISLRCITKDGNITILEYPVKASVQAKAPAGNYTYVAWVGGRQFTGSFSLSKDQDMVLNIFKDRIDIK